MKTGLNATLDPTRQSNEAREFETALRRNIVDQDQAVEKVAEIYHGGRVATLVASSGDTRITQAEPR